MRIAIGTNSDYKVNAIKHALYLLDFEFESVFDKADSEISEQPNKAGETKLGSINRARNILTKFPDNDIGPGVEFGYEPIEGKYHMVCWASIATSDNRIFSEQSSTLELPTKLVNALENDISVDSALNETLDQLHQNQLCRQFVGYIKKRRIIYECTENVMLRYLFDKELYN